MKYAVLSLAGAIGLGLTLIAIGVGRTRNDLIVVIYLGSVVLNAILLVLGAHLTISDRPKDSGDS